MTNITTKNADGSTIFIASEGAGTDVNPNVPITAEFQLNPLKRAMAQIESDYGDAVSVVNKNKKLTKFGRNDDLDDATSSGDNTGVNASFAGYLAGVV